MADVPSVNKKTLNLVAYMRQKGFNPEDIELITAVADPEVVCKTKKAYVEWLANNRGVYLDYDYALSLMKRPEFHECVNLLYTQEKGAALRAVEKALLKRATDPEDSHGVAAARLLFQANGLLGNDDRAGAGSVEHQFVKFVMDVRQGKIEGTIATKQRFTVQTPGLLPEEAQGEAGTTVDADYEVTEGSEAKAEEA